MEKGHVCHSRRSVWRRWEKVLRPWFARNRWAVCLFLMCSIVTLFHRDRLSLYVIGSPQLPVRLPSLYKTLSSASRLEGWGPPRPPLMQACVHPNLPLYSPEISAHIQKVPPIQCSEDEDWVYTGKGKLFISNSAVRRHGTIQCDYTPISFGIDDDTVAKGDTVRSVSNGTSLLSDAFDVLCRAADGKTYHNVQTGIKPQLQGPAPPLPPDSMKVGVLMLGQDSLSRAMWQRMLPRTHHYFTETMGGMLLNGYNIVGDGTPAALIPILTGGEEAELPEVRRGFRGASNVDVFPFIWKEFEKIGGATFFAEDYTKFATFNMRMNGFRQPPTHHYTRPFYMKAEEIYHRSNKHCLGSKPRHLLPIDMLREFVKIYTGRIQFAFNFHNELCHDDNNKIQNADEDFRDFLQFLMSGNYLNNTIVILMSDHGARFSRMRVSEQGKLEERMPYFGFRFPPWFYDRYPREMENFMTNTNRLTTPFDIHATFRDLLHHSPPTMGDITDTGISLFNEVPPERTCDDAKIDAHWCACMKWEHLTAEDPDVVTAVQAVIDFINTLTSEHRSQCSQLELHAINSGARYKTNDHVLHFKKSLDYHGRVPDMRDDMDVKPLVFYHVTFVSRPGMGLFEATVKRHAGTSDISVSAGEISRLNAYGDTPHCIYGTAPHLRPYCVCPDKIHVHVPNN